MNIYLLSNNLVIDEISYIYKENLEQKRLSRPLSIEGEKLAQSLSEELKVNNIYSSNYASAIATAKYFANKNNCIIKINGQLNDSKIGEIGKHNIKMLRYMQDRNLDFKYPQGESLNETKNRLVNVLKEIILENEDDVLIISHKRAIMSLLLEYCEKGFNLDEKLLLSFKENVVMDDSESDYELIKLEIENKKIVNIVR
ncbi:MAG: histidine phosphatase family protein [Firmicutes bacterium]|nr:histidine phosphatase family protein [Bacillota bacterium]